jgi:hypothetical protein
VTYVRIKHSNLTLTDQVGVGCDRFNGAADLQTCVDGNFNYTNQSYDFYNLQVPADSRLPGGGGYRVRGVSNPKPTVPTGQPSAVTIADELEYTWSGFDTNFIWRARGAVSASTAARAPAARFATCATASSRFSRWGVRSSVFPTSNHARAIRRRAVPRPASIQLCEAAPPMRSHGSKYS